MRTTRFKRCCGYPVGLGVLVALLTAAPYPSDVASAFDVSLGALICSLEGEVQHGDAVLGAQHVVACSFQPENGGAVSQYIGTLLLQRDGKQQPRRSFIWIVRGPQSYSITPPDLAQVYTSLGTVTAGTIAPLVPRDRDGGSVGLFTLGDAFQVDPARAGGARQPRSDPVVVLDIKLVGAAT